MTVYMYTAPYCVVCQPMKPIMEQICDEEHVSFVTMDIETFPDEAIQLGINSLPTFIFEKDGQEVFRHVGAMTRQAAYSMIRYSK